MTVRQVPGQLALWDGPAPTPAPARRRRWHRFLIIDLSRPATRRYQPIHGRRIATLNPPQEYL